VGSEKTGYGPNLDMYLGYQTVTGYNALFLKRYYDYLNYYIYDKESHKQGHSAYYYGSYKNQKMMDLLNVKYEISHSTKTCAIRKTYLPRAFIVPNYRILDKDDILPFINSDDFIPSQTVLFEKNDFHDTSLNHSLNENNVSGKATITYYRPDQITISTESSGRGYLFLSEIYYPGWKAFIDDKPVKILRGNYMFRVIYLPPGRHEVHFLFDPLSIKVGIGLTILALFMLINILIYHFAKRRSMALSNK
jgi:uncharacterized membrane protein YfhO